MRKPKKPILVEYKNNPKAYRHIPVRDIYSHHEHTVRKVDGKS